MIETVQKRSCSSEVGLRIRATNRLNSGAWVMRALEMIDALTNLDIRHGQHPTHQVVSIGVEPFAAFDWFQKKVD